MNPKSILPNFVFVYFPILVKLQCLQYMKTFLFYMKWPILRAKNGKIMHLIGNCLKWVSTGLVITKMKILVFTFLDLLPCCIFYNYFAFRPSSFTNFSLLIPYLYFWSLNVIVLGIIIQIWVVPSSLC